VRWAAWLYREADTVPVGVPPALIGGLSGLRRT
jgi:hypothetical protein